LARLYSPFSFQFGSFLCDKIWSRTTDDVTKSGHGPPSVWPDFHFTKKQNHLFVFMTVI
jgi:hypothetical protein